MLVEEIEVVRGRMQEMSAREEALLRSLAESIHEAEQRLLQHVRAIAERHGESRSQLLAELKSLASGLGAFPSYAGTVTSTFDRGVATPVPYEMMAEATAAHFSTGHWREATRAIAQDDDDDLEQLLRANAR